MDVPEQGVDGAGCVCGMYGYVYGCGRGWGMGTWRGKSMQRLQKLAAFLLTVCDKLAPLQGCQAAPAASGNLCAQQVPCAGSNVRCVRSPGVERGLAVGKVHSILAPEALTVPQRQHLRQNVHEPVGQLSALSACVHR